MHKTLHQPTPQFYMFYFRHTTPLIGPFHVSSHPQVSLDINTTSNHWPVTTARVAQLEERKAAVLEDPGSNPTNTLFFFFFLQYLQVARYSLHNSSIHPSYFFFHRDNNLRRVQSIVLDVSTKSSGEEPPHITFQGGGRPRCRVPLQVQF